MASYVIGIDPGQSTDPTAITVIEYDPAGKPDYRLRALHRLPIGTPYTDLPRELGARVGIPPLVDHVMLAIDATGVGAPVIDLVREGLPKVPVYGITITAGTSVTGTSRNPHVPKRDLIATTAVILESRRLRIAENMRDTSALVDEFFDYRRTTSDSGMHSYGAAAGAHDDLVLAVSVALWAAEHKAAVRRRGRTTSSPVKHRIPGVRRTYDPSRLRWR